MRRTRVPLQPGPSHSALTRRAGLGMDQGRGRRIPSLRTRPDVLSPKSARVRRSGTTQARKGRGGAQAGGGREV